jgi:hypothetical protein
MSRSLKEHYWERESNVGTDTIGIGDFLTIGFIINIKRIIRIHLSTLLVMIPQNTLTPLLSRFIKLSLSQYSLETFTGICHKLLSRKYDEDHETIQAIVQYVWQHTRAVREAVAIAKIVDTSDEVNNIASTLTKYSG